MVGFLSGAYVELRLEALSKCPERFSRRVDCMLIPESLYMVGVLGKGGNEVDVGDDLGDGGDAPLTVELVDGR